MNLGHARSTTGVLEDKGAIDCSANPNYPAATAGHTYRVSVAGKIGGASGVDVIIGDVIRCKATSVTGNHATVGANFDIIGAKIVAGGLANATLANMAQATVKGRASGAGTGVPTDLTATQLTAIANAVVGDSGSGGTKGMVPAPSSGDAALKKSLMADGTWGYGIFGLDGNKYMYTADSAVASSGSYSTTGMARLTTVRHSTPSYGYREMYVKLGAANSAFDIADSVQGSWYDVNGGTYFAAWWLALSPAKGFKRNTTTGAVEVVSPDTRVGYGGAAEINFQNRWAADGIKYKASTFGSTGGMGTLGIQIVPEAQNFDGLMGADGYHLNAALLIGRSSDTSTAISDKAKSHIAILLDPNCIAPDGVGIYINGNDADTAAGGSADASKSPLAGLSLNGAFDHGIDLRTCVTHTGTVIAVPDLYRVTWAYDGGTDQVDLTSATDGSTKKLVCNKKFQSAGFLTSADILPTVTEVTNIGSASFEFNNCYLQNAVTVSDMRRKNDLGEIDGDQALSLITHLIPRWFTFKDRVIPAHTRVQSQTRDVAVPAKIERRRKEEKFTDEAGVEQTRAIFVDELLPEHIEQRLVEVEVDIDEQVVTHGRPHAGFFAQQFKEAMTAAGIKDFAGYAYESETDTHLLRLLEMVAVLTAGIKRQNERIAVLEAGAGSASRLPAPDALLSDFGTVGESYDDITGDILLDTFERDEVAAAAVVQVLSATRQRHLSEQLNVEKGRLRREHMLTDVPHPREASIDRLLGLLTRRGD